jgi:hypothetical protein
VTLAIMCLLAGVVLWLPLPAPRRQQPEEVDKEISKTWRRFVDGEITETEAAQRDTELRLRRARPP